MLRAENDSSTLANFGVDIVEGKIWVDQLNNQTSQNRVYAIGISRLLPIKPNYFPFYAALTNQFWLLTIYINVF